MIAPRIEFSTREERLEFVQDRHKCKAPACGGCGSCHLPGGRPAIEVFADYIDGKREYASLSAELWKL